jgi:1-acyl-sn-glycerol-3-phosphate acyltransferase
MQRLVSLTRLSVGFVLMALISLAFGTVMLVLFPFRRLRLDLFNIYGTIVGRMIIWLAGVTPRVSHKERLKKAFPAIYIGNHTSTLDAFIFFWLSPLGVTGVVKREITLIPFFGQIYWLSGNLLINRRDKQGSIATLKKVVEFVRQYKLGFMIMPEGTRSKDGRLLPFKTGFVHQAIDMGLPIVPTVLHGVYKNWEKGTFNFVPMTVDIEVLEPVDTSKWKHETAQEHADAVHALYVAALRDDQKPMPASTAMPSSMERDLATSPSEPALGPVVART